MEPILGLNDQDEKTAAPTREPLVRRHFSRSEISALDGVGWTRRTARAGDFVQKDVEAPDFWSDQAVAIVAKLYFATIDGVRENSVRQLIERVVTTYREHAYALGYFDTLTEAYTFSDELAWLLVHQRASFNSPVWFNVGVPGREPAVSACYLLSVEDRMIGPGSITDWWAKEAKIFKSGAGSGVNISKVRGSMEPLSTGGLASGPLSYMPGANACAESLRSGGAHRRAAKFVRMDADHPDIRNFNNSKVREDERMRALAAAGINMDPSTEEGQRNIAESTAFQSANNSVGVTDEFMRKATGEDPDPSWPLIARVSGEVIETVDARELLDEIAEAAWLVADPGLQFDTTINAGNTTPEVGPIRTSNVCGEIVQPDDTACNLCALNLLSFVGENGTFAVDDFRAAIDVIVLAMDVSCSFGWLPTPEVERNVREMRHLGLGYANLGASLMSLGLPYDSDEGRLWASSVTSLMTARAYRRSAELADRMGAFDRFSENRRTMLDVVERHCNETGNLRPGFYDDAIANAAIDDYEFAQNLAERAGYRNALVTTSQPTGTCSFMMDCATTGCEPGTALVTTKALAAGGSMTMTLDCVGDGLERLGYGFSTEEEVRVRGTVVGVVRPEHEAVFATALGDNTISPLGHVRMLGAMQPFLSQAISKTVNCPAETTPVEIRDVLVEAWRVGAKSITVYRDGSKMTQVIRASKPKARDDEVVVVEAEAPALPVPVRRRLKRERESLTVKFSVGGHEGYITAGRHEDGSLGELFLTGIGQEGSTLRGLMSAWSIAVSIMLQYGVPLDVVVRKYRGMRFEPSGRTDDRDIPTATSMVDYVVRWLASRFGDEDLAEEVGVLTPAVRARAAAENAVTIPLVATLGTTPYERTVTPALSPNGHAKSVDFSNPCPQCGQLTVQTGNCRSCPSCFWHAGCG